MANDNMKQRLPVTAIRRDGDRWYYMVTYRGLEYSVRMFDSQRGQPKPDELDCIVKSDASGRPVVSQDYAPLIARQYKKGGVYDFKVVRSQVRPGAWQVLTPDGLLFNLEGSPARSYEERSTIRCRVKEIRDVLVTCEEVPRSGPALLEGAISPSALSAMADECGMSAGEQLLLRRTYESDPALNTSREMLTAGDPGWLPEALRIARRDLSKWIGDRRDGRDGDRPGLKDSNRIRLLADARRVGVHIVERSGLAGASDYEKSRLRDDIARTLHLLDSYSRALTLRAQGQLQRFATDIVTSLGKTGYIYQPGERLEVLTAAMSLDGDLESQFIGDFLEALRARRQEEWMNEPLRSALLGVLDGYVHSLQHRADRLLNATRGDGREIAKRLVKVLALMLLLTSGDEQHVNRHLVMCRLCRFASLLKPALAESLTERAYAFLFGELPQRVPFNWAEAAADSAEVIGYKLSTLPKPALGETYSHEGARGSVACSAAGIEVRRRGYAGKEHTALPDKFLDWPHFQVRLRGKRGDREVDASSHDLMELRRAWRDIEERLFADADDGRRDEAPQGRPKRTPAVDDMVYIRVVRPEGTCDDKGNPIFRAVIDDPDTGIEGEGLLSPLGLVRYWVKQASTRCFTDRKGRPYFLYVRVVSIDANGLCQFSALPLKDERGHDVGDNLVAEFLVDNVRAGDVLRCRVSRDQLEGKYLLVCSDKGFSLQVRKDGRCPELRNGQPCQVTVEQVYENGDIDAHFDHLLPPDNTLNEVSDLSAFVRFYSEGNQGDEEAALADGAAAGDEPAESMTREEVLELVSLIDRRATLESDRVTAFNYLCAAKILAECVGDDERVVEYRERMTLIDLTEQYAVNQRLDADDYAEHFRRSSYTLGSFPELYAQAEALYCVSHLGRPGDEEELLHLAQSGAGDTTSAVAALVLAHNLMLPHSLPEACAAVRSRINRRLGTETADETREHLGEEGPQLEFKASAVFPADNNMRANAQRQMTRLAQVLCGMMNTQGGRLLVGVNDLGYAIGLDNDYRALSKSPTYDAQKARDVLDNEFLQFLRRHMPRESANSLATHFELHDGRDVYVVDCKPTPSVMSVDGQAYRRYGRSTNLMDDRETQAVAQLKAKSKT